MSMETILSSIIKELKLDDRRITNIYNYGSWVYGTNHEKSDRDFLIVMKSEDENEEKSLQFYRDFDYFHEFPLHRLKNTDVTIHSCNNFELLLEKNYMLAVECVFYPNEFILRNTIDYKTIYLSKYYNPLRLKQVIFYEHDNSMKYIIENDEDYFRQKPIINSTINNLLCDAIHTTTIDEDRIFKYLFHGLRYLDIGEQLIRTKSINDFKRASYLLFEIKELFLNNNKNIDFVVNYIEMKSKEYKTIINELLSTNSIDGIFKIYITVDDYNIKHFLNICQINKFKPIFIHLNNDENCKQLMTSLYYTGTYSNIMEQIKILIDLKFKDFNIKRIKIKSLISNNGVPDNDIDKLLFWDKKSNYFEFHYKILIESKNKLEILKTLCEKKNIHFACNTFNEMYYIVTMRLFNVGRINAFHRNNYIIQFLKNINLPPLKVKSHFIVYDSNINLDNAWTPSISYPPTTNSSLTDIRPKYRIGFKNRKVPPRST